MKRWQYCAHVFVRWEGVQQSKYTLQHSSKHPHFSAEVLEVMRKFELRISLCEVWRTYAQCFVNNLLVRCETMCKEQGLNVAPVQICTI